MRLKRFRIFPCWGSAEAYPPENADFSVLRARDEEALRSLNLKPVSRLCQSNACIIASKDSLQAGDFSGLLRRFASAGNIKDKPWRKPEMSTAAINNDLTPSAPQGNIWLALADGHQQVHTSAFLEKAGITMQGYSKDAMRRRPSCGIDWLSIKVIRPQDMPQQVANGNFDLAITGTRLAARPPLPVPLQPGNRAGRPRLRLGTRGGSGQRRGSGGLSSCYPGAYLRGQDGAAAHSHGVCQYRR